MQQRAVPRQVTGIFSLSTAQNVLPQDKLTELHKVEYRATHFSAGRTVLFLTQPAGLSSLQHLTPPGADVGFLFKWRERPREGTIK